MSQFDPLPTFTPYFSKIHLILLFHLRLGFPPDLRFLIENFISISVLHECYMSRASHCSLIGLNYGVLHDKEPSDTIKGGEFLDQLNGYHLLKKNSVAWS